MFYYFNIYIYRSSPYFWVCNWVTKYPCFLCKWDTRVDREHYSRRIWPECNNLHTGSRNII